ncbi:MAG: hypothetical protein IJ662_09160 [Clostridia bacterium]|nr:hypothetical protein [Clostridia bacterium]
MEQLDGEIEQAEKEAFAEQMQEARQAIAKGMTDEGSKVGKEIAAAIAKGLNGGK